jgi:hypothetical protein
VICTAEANFAGCVLGKLPRIGFPFERCADADPSSQESRVTLAARLTGKSAAETISAMLAVFGRSTTTPPPRSLAKGESRGAVVSHEPQEPPREGLAPEVASSALNAPRTARMATIAELLELGAGLMKVGEAELDRGHRRGAHDGPARLGVLAIESRTNAVGVDHQCPADLER